MREVNLLSKGKDLVLTGAALDEYHLDRFERASELKVTGDVVQFPLGMAKDVIGHLASETGISKVRPQVMLAQAAMLNATDSELLKSIVANFSKKEILEAYQQTFSSISPEPVETLSTDQSIALMNSKPLDSPVQEPKTTNPISENINSNTGGSIEISEQLAEESEVSEISGDDEAIVHLDKKTLGEDWPEIDVKVGQRFSSTVEAGHIQFHEFGEVGYSSFYKAIAVKIKHYPHRGMIIPLEGSTLYSLKTAAAEYGFKVRNHAELLEEARATADYNKDHPESVVEINIPPDINLESPGEDFSRTKESDITLVEGLSGKTASAELTESINNELNSQLEKNLIEVVDAEIVAQSIQTNADVPGSLVIEQTLNESASEIQTPDATKQKVKPPKKEVKFSISEYLNDNMMFIGGNSFKLPNGFETSPFPEKMVRTSTNDKKIIQWLTEATDSYAIPFPDELNDECVRSLMHELFGNEKGPTPDQRLRSKSEMDELRRQQIVTDAEKRITHEALIDRENQNRKSRDISQEIRAIFDGSKHLKNDLFERANLSAEQYSGARLAPIIADNERVGVQVEPGFQDEVVTVTVEEQVSPISNEVDDVKAIQLPSHENLTAAEKISYKYFAVLKDNEIVCSGLTEGMTAIDIVNLGEKIGGDLVWSHNKFSNQSLAVVDSAKMPAIDSPQNPYLNAIERYKDLNPTIKQVASLSEIEEMARLKNINCEIFKDDEYQDIFVAIRVGNKNRFLVVAQGGERMTLNDKNGLSVVETIYENHIAKSQDHGNEVLEMSLS